MASSSSITPSSSKLYDVYLSFKVADNRYGFISYLYHALHENNISTFIDDRRRIGDEMSPEFSRPIEGTRISVIIFSKHYASSRQCLEELVKIIECREKYNQIVIPVYYDIEPSHVRHQTEMEGCSDRSIKSTWLRFIGIQAELTLRIANAISKKLDKDGEADGNKATGGQSRGEELNPAPKIKAEWFQWITAEQKFVATNFILELPSVVFDKLSSVHKPQYALLSMLMSFMTMLIGIIQLVYQGRKGRVVWKRREKLPWFYYPSPSDKPFGTVTDFIGLLCAIFQSIFTAIDYALYLRHINDPIQISIWPLVFSFCLMCSTVFKEFPKKDASTESRDG